MSEKVNSGLSPVGGIGLTRLSVYEQRPAPDGLMSGCPHIHAICEEAYYVLRGKGRAEFHDPVNGFRTVGLSEGDYLDFPANVLHRIISECGLEILGIMSNAGLPEQGEARIYFGPEVDANPEAYQKLLALPREKGLSGALERRDAAVRAYLELLHLERADHTAYIRELERFTTLHATESKKCSEDYSAIIKRGPVCWGEAALNRLEHLPSYAVSRKQRLSQPGENIIFGMCGVLKPVQLL